MSKKTEGAAGKTRHPNTKGQKTNNEVEITDENPKYCTYNNPPGFKYVEAIVTSPSGKVISEGLICLPIDQIERIKKSK